MRRAVWAGIAGLLVLLCSPAAGGERFQTSAIIGLFTVRYYGNWEVPLGDPAEVLLIGGVLAGTGWVSDLMLWSDSATGPWKVAGKVTGQGERDSLIDARRFMREGERVSVYYVEAGVLGEATLTDYGSDSADGLVFGAKPRISAGKEDAFRRTSKLSWGDQGPHMLAVWAPGGGRPHWVTGELLNPKNTVYRSVVERWLAARGVSSSVIRTAVVEQIVRTDINRDGRQEVFLSFHTPDAPGVRPKQSGKRVFSYLVMRQLSGDAGLVKTVVVDDSADRVHKVDGFCDLDEDGTAEVATDYLSAESWGTALFRWDGSKFRQVAGQESTAGD